MTGPWWQQPVRFFQHLLRESDAVGLDPARLIDEVRSVGAGAYVAMGGGFSAWYPSRLASQRVNPHLTFDFLGAVTAEAHRAGIRLVARLDISKGRPEWLERDPDWFVRSADGTPSLVWEMPQTCPTGPFWQREAFAILDEMLERYALDGLFLNYLNVARCHCPRCREVVRAATGADVPPAGAREPEYERWRQDYLAAFVRRLRDFVHRRRPDAALIPYHHVRDGWNYRAMAALADIVSAQASNPLAVNPVDPQPHWNHWAAEEALAARALRPDCAPLLIHTASEFFASRQTAMPAARFVRNAIQACAHGANAAPAVNGTLDQDDPRLVPHIRALGRYLERNASWYAGLRSLARVALVRSEDSLNWGPDAGRMAGNPGVPGHVGEFRGCYEMLVQLRHPCDVIPGGGLSATDLSPYGAVVLPAVSCLGPEDAAAIDAYVAAGGTAIVTADTGACDRNGRPAPEPALPAMPGLPGVPRTVFGAYFKLADPALRQAVGGAPHVGADGEFWSPPVPAGATCDLRLVGPFRNNAPEFTTVPGTGDAPGLIALRRGAGRLVWLPWRIGALFHAAAIPEYAALFGRVLEDAVGAPPIRTDAPDAVECILYAHDRGEVLHLVNAAAVQSKPSVDTIPLAGFEVSVRSRAESAIRLDTGGPLALRRDGANVVLRIDRLEIFAAIALVAPSGRLAATG